jgi:hypothetical protein
MHRYLGRLFGRQASKGLYEPPLLDQMPVLCPFYVALSS